METQKGLDRKKQTVKRNWPRKSGEESQNVKGLTSLKSEWIINKAKGG